MFKFLHLTLLLVLFSFVSRSQNEPKAILLSINKQATIIDGLFNQMDNSIKKDKHKQLEPKIHDLKTALIKIETDASALQAEYLEKITAILKEYKISLDDFEKLVHKKSLLDKDKILDATYLELKNRQTALRNFLKETYTKIITAPVQQPQDTIVQKPRRNIIVQQPQQDTLNQLPPKNTILPTGQQVTTQPVQGTNEPEVLISIRQAESMIAQLIDSIHLALKKNQFEKIAKMAKSISTASDKIQDLTLLLKSDQKINVKILAGGLKVQALKLHELADKGIAAHKQLHETIEIVEAKFSTLSTGIKILK